ncbi:MAG: response regulator [Candidatus Korobacteraceae bacterium]
MLKRNTFLWGTIMGSEPLHKVSLTHPSQNVPKLILSVDDEASILFTRHQLLQAAGYDVLSAADGEQALCFFAAHPVDLVLLDYVMPGLNGGAVAQKMKHSKRDVPIIMVSALSNAETTLTCADWFITKGDGPVSLLEAISRLLAPTSIHPSAVKKSGKLYAPEQK